MNGLWFMRASPDRRIALAIALQEFGHRQIDDGLLCGQAGQSLRFGEYILRDVDRCCHGGLPYCAVPIFTISAICSVGGFSEGRGAQLAELVGVNRSQPSRWIKDQR
jgi:hypothetical protein